MRLSVSFWKLNLNATRRISDNVAAFVNATAIMMQAATVRIRFAAQLAVTPFLFSLRTYKQKIMS